MPYLSTHLVGCAEMPRLRNVTYGGLAATAIVVWVLIGFLVAFVVGAPLQSGLSETDPGRGLIGLAALALALMVASTGGVLTIRRLRRIHPFLEQVGEPLPGENRTSLDPLRATPVIAESTPPSPM